MTPGDRFGCGKRVEHGPVLEARGHPGRQRRPRLGRPPPRVNPSTTPR